MEALTIEAKSVAALSRAIQELDHETRARITATENGAPWAYLTVSPMTDTMRSVFPNLNGSGALGDTRKIGQSGVAYRANEAAHALAVVINRAIRMAR